MKRFLVTVICLAVLFGMASGQDIRVASVDGAWEGNTKVDINRPITFNIYVNTPPEGISGSTNGFRIFLSSNGSPSGILYSGSGFAPITYSTHADFSNFATYTELSFGIDGYGADTIGFGGVSFGNPVHINNQLTWTITTQVDSMESTWLCIDKALYPPFGVWVWSVYDLNDVSPSWSGPHCYYIEQMPCCYNTGDVTGDGLILVDDLTLLVNYIFKSGPPPYCSSTGDVTGDGKILIDDLIYLVNYIFKSGPPSPPCN